MKVGDRVRVKPGLHDSTSRRLGGLIGIVVWVDYWGPTSAAVEFNDPVYGPREYPFVDDELEPVPAEDTSAA